MNVFVKAKPGSDKNAVTKISGNVFEVRVTAQPERGLANQAIVKQLADYFDVTPSNVRLISGPTVKIKLFEIVGI
jgi:uncharacterized protein YggU (UPF0235/DUF167 family)